ncbi:MAG: hypothetical protein ACR2Q4_14320 [Geminicoccaceae bacterium]
MVQPRIEHCSITEDNQIARLKELEIYCSFLIAHGVSRCQRRD